MFQLSTHGDSSCRGHQGGVTARAVPAFLFAVRGSAEKLYPMYLAWFSNFMGLAICCLTDRNVSILIRQVFIIDATPNLRHQLWHIQHAGREGTAVAALLFVVKGLCQVVGRSSSKAG